MENILSFMTLIACIILLPSLPFSIALDSIALSQSITDGMTLVSKGGTFELGFFSPGNSKNRYLGIWYKNIPIQTVVWVANRLNPINDSTSGILALNSIGNLVLTQNHTVVWYTTTSSNKAQNPVAKLLDSGNFVVQEKINEADPDAFLWQSFDYPSDTLLPGMKFGWDLKTGLNRHLTAWKSPEDPSPGDFSFGLDLNNFPEFYFKKGNKKVYRTGPWNGLYASGLPGIKPNPIYNYSFVFSENEISYNYNLKDKSVLSRLVLNQTDSLRYRYVWSDTNQNWTPYTAVPGDYCDHYGLCGANGNCIHTTDSPTCQCLKGFRPKYPKEWDSVNWSQGCVRNKPLSCQDKQKHGFIKISGLKFPDTTHTWLNRTMGLKECREKCLNNCSCMAYTNSDIRGQGSGCVMWFDNLVDIKQLSDNEQDLYIRMSVSELEAEYMHKKKLTTIVATITTAAILGTVLVGSYCIHKFCRNLKDQKDDEADENNGDDEEDMNLLLLEFSSVANATDNFSMTNKIGQGGFGPVYKGKLENGQEIAVKKLSKSSRQGMIEFKNEVKLIAKLQHRNLVKLLGYCIHRQEKMLVYEYMPNNSLDSFIFDHTKGKVLKWSKRFSIICGIARGLLYLHQDSRLRIIHRDLKASNILLDKKLNPKISDFGMAKTFGGDQTEGNTNRIVGTYGYMAPEYAADGQFSVKSDIFSFGILMLEIISGKRNRGFYCANHILNLISHAWIMWKEDRAIELIDSNIEDSCIISEVLRCFHVSLLCVQQHSEDRPAMPSIVLMLGSENELPEPKEPGFFPRKHLAEENSDSNQSGTSPTNEITNTLSNGR